MVKNLPPKSSAKTPRGGQLNDEGFEAIFHAPKQRKGEESSSVGTIETYWTKDSGLGTGPKVTKTASMNQNPPKSKPNKKVCGNCKHYKSHCRCPRENSASYAPEWNCAYFSDPNLFTSQSNENLSQSSRNRLTPKPESLGCTLCRQPSRDCRCFVNEERGDFIANKESRISQHERESDVDLDDSSIVMTLSNKGVKQSFSQRSKGRADSLVSVPSVKKSFSQSQHNVRALSPQRSISKLSVKSASFLTSPSHSLPSQSDELKSMPSLRRKSGSMLSPNNRLETIQSGDVRSESVMSDELDFDEVPAHEKKSGSLRSVGSKLKSFGSKLKMTGSIMSSASKLRKSFTEDERTTNKLRSIEEKSFSYEESFSKDHTRSLSFTCDDAEDPEIVFEGISLDDAEDADLETGKREKRADEGSQHSYPSDTSTYDDEKQPMVFSRKKQLSCLFSLSLIISLAVSLWFFNGKSFKWDGNRPKLPSKWSNKNFGRFKSSFLHISSLADLEDESKPQNKAIQWIMKSDPFHLKHDDPAVQVRYVMALFVYSAFSEEEAAKYLLWYGSRGVCEWFGVKCGSDGVVEKIKLDEHGLTGSIPYELSSLDSLKTVNLSHNALKGTIPRSFDNFTNLEVLNLAHNLLTGSIPDNIFLMKSLTSLIISNNKVSGKIPEPIDLIISDNKVSGTIPDHIDTHLLLNEMKLDHNLLTGTIPNNLGSFTALVKLDLSSNILTGRIPPSIERLVALKELKITQNKINGPIPTGLYGISLFHFHASDNELTGTLPSDFGGMSHLKTLHLDKNKISGGIPLGFASLVSLTEVHLNRNDITGSVPSAVCDLVYMKKMLELWVDCGVSKDERGWQFQEVECECCTQCFTDPVLNRDVDIMAKLSQVSDISTLENSETPQHKAAKWIINGDPEGMHPKNQGLVQRYIVATFGYATFPSNGLVKDVAWYTHEHECDWFGIICDEKRRVKGIEMANNNLTGIIISELSSLPFLFGLDLSSNKLFGEIPESLGNLETLTLIDISGNHLVSTIPESFFTSTSLQYLYLSKNKLSGTIPSALGTNEAIIELWLHDNQLTGPIPDSFISTTSLEDLDLHSNMFSGFIPSSIVNAVNISYIDLSENKIRGSIPAQLYDTSLEFLYLSTNELTGPVSSGLKNMVGLKELGLDSNMLTGTIPMEVGSLINAEYIDLHGNMFTGAVPPTVGQLASVNYLDVSDNLLSGGIPDEAYSLSNLEFLILSSNSFSGTISSQLSKLEKLFWLHLDQNSMSGTIPTEVINMNLARLSLHSNMLVGKLPEVADDSNPLMWLDVSNNRLSGSLPRSWYFLESLTRLYVDRNQLTGTIGKDIGLLKKLNDLWLNDNMFSEGIPLELGMMSDLERLYLEKNEFSGGMSILVCNLFQNGVLQELSSDCESPPNPPRVKCACCTKCFSYEDEREDRIRGLVSSVTDSDILDEEETSQAKALKWLISEDPALLSLAEPKRVLQRYIVAILGFATFPVEGPKNALSWYSLSHECNWHGIVCDEESKVVEISMKDNGLIGEIPLELSKLTHLTRLDLSSNKLTGEISSTMFPKNIATINLSENNLTGSIPNQIYDLASLESLHLSTNELTGSLSTAIGKLMALKELHLEQNRFTGEVPIQLGQLPSLSVIYLQVNSFVGAIPNKLCGNDGKIWADCVEEIQCTCCERCF